MQSLFILPENSKWQEALDASLHEFYQRPGYLKLEAATNKAIPKAYFFEENGHIMLIPLMLFDLPYGKFENYKFDAKSPYGYAGILFSKGFPQELVAQAFQKLKEASTSEGILTIFIKLNSLLNTQDFRNIEMVKYEELGPMIYINLEKDIPVLNKETSSRHTDNIKKLKKKGFEARFNDTAFLENFIEAYWETMERQNAQETYFFSKEYFYELFKVMREDLVFCSIHDPEGKFASGGFFSKRDFIGRAILTATVEDYLSLGVSKYVYISTRDYLKEQNCKVLHLGGGLGLKLDSIYYFKSGFSSDSLPFKCLSVNVDNRAYSAYIEMIQDRDDDQFENPNYFPTYRSALLKKNI